MPAQTGKKRLPPLVYLGFAGITLILLFNFIGFIFPTYHLETAQPVIAPEDIVYGKAIHAEYAKNTGNNSLRAQTPTVEPGSGQPKIWLSEIYYDFGTINPAFLPATHQIFITNQGQADLLIKNAYTTCSCTIADITAAVIPPGKTALLTLSFNPVHQNINGFTIRRGIIFETNDPEQPVQEIWFQVTVAGLPPSQSDQKK